VKANIFPALFSIISNSLDSKMLNKIID